MRRLRLIVTAVAAAAVLSACGSADDGAADDGTGAPSPEPTAATTAPTASATPEPTITTAPTYPPAPTPPPEPTSPVPEPPAPTTTPVEPRPSPSATMPELGVLVGIPEPGVEPGCIVLDGHLLLGGDRDLLLSGQELRITGAVENVMTTCQQGIPFRVDSATPVDP